jgi:hypothetical protein
MVEGWLGSGLAFAVLKGNFSGSFGAFEQAVSARIKPNNATIAPRTASIRAVRHFPSAIHPPSNTAFDLVPGGANSRAAIRIFVALQQNNEVDKRYQTKVKVIVRNITPKA